MVKIQSTSDPIKDTNGRNYKLVTLEAPAFKEMVDLQTGESILALASPKTTKKCVWEKNYLDDTKHVFYDAKVGTVVYGSIHTVSTDEYEIEGKDGEIRKVSTYTGFIEALPKDADFDSKVNSMLLSAGRELAKDADSNFEVAKEHQPSNEVEELAKESVEEQF